MISAVLVTEGGAHPPEKWATAIANQLADLIVIPDDAVSQTAIDGRVAKEQLRGALAQGLLPIFAEVKAHELRQFKKHANRYAMPYLPGVRFDDAMAAVRAAFAASPFAEHFAQPEVDAALVSMVGSGMTSVRHVERLWRADGEPDNADAQAFKEAWNG